MDPVAAMDILGGERKERKEEKGPARRGKKGPRVFRTRAEIRAAEVASRIKKIDSDEIRRENVEREMLAKIGPYREDFTKGLPAVNTGNPKIEGAYLGWNGRRPHSRTTFKQVQANDLPEDKDFMNSNKPQRNMVFSRTAGTKGIVTKFKDPFSPNKKDHHLHRTGGTLHRRTLRACQKGVDLHGDPRDHHSDLFKHIQNQIGALFEGGFASDAKADGFSFVMKDGNPIYYAARNQKGKIAKRFPHILAAYRKHISGGKQLQGRIANWSFAQTNTTVDPGFRRRARAMTNEQILDHGARGLSYRPGYQSAAARRGITSYDPVDPETGLPDPSGTCLTGKNSGNRVNYKGNLKLKKNQNNACVVSPPYTNADQSATQQFNLRRNSPPAWDYFLKKSKLAGKNGRRVYGLDAPANLDSGSFASLLNRGGDHIATDF